MAKNQVTFPARLRDIGTCKVITFKSDAALALNADKGDILEITATIIKKGNATVSEMGHEYSLDSGSPLFAEA